MNILSPLIANFTLTTFMVPLAIAPVFSYTIYVFQNSPTASILAGSVLLKVKMEVHFYK